MNALRIASAIRNPQLRSAVSVLVSAHVLPDGVLREAMRARVLLLGWIPLVITLLSVVESHPVVGDNAVYTQWALWVGIILRAILDALSPQRVQQPTYGVLNPSAVPTYVQGTTSTETEDIVDDYEGVITAQSAGADVDSDVQEDPFS